MPTFNREKLEQELRDLNDPRRCAAFAARMALYTLPFLWDERTEEKGLCWYWPEDKRQRYLFDTLRAVQTAWSIFWIEDQTAVKAATDATDAADAARAAARSVIAQVRISANDITPADASNAAYVTDAATYAAAAAAATNIYYAAAYAARTAAAYAAVARHNIIMMEFNFLNSNNILNFLQRHLIPHPAINRHKEHFFLNLQRISGNFTYWVEWMEERYNGELFDIEKLHKFILLPEEIQIQPPAQINAYLKQLSNDHLQQPLNRIRAIFIGHGAAGKTSLIRALHGEPVVQGKEAMTPGVDIIEWPLDDTGITAHFWDFGGQVVMHATHQFFLRAGCVYVLVLDARNEINANEQAEYWLEHVRTYGGDAPVLVVGNKADQARVNLDLASLQRADKYPNITGFYHLSCTGCQGEYREEFALFRRDFTTQLKQTLESAQIYLSTAHRTVLDRLRADYQDKAFLAKQTYSRLCKQAGVPVEEDTLNRDWLLDLLDKLGIVIYFPQLQWHKDTYVLNPHWLTYGVYTLICAEQTQRRHGRLSLDDVTEILKEKKAPAEPGKPAGKALKFPRGLSYPKDRCRFIIDAMERFQLCYRLDPDTVIIPAQLSTTAPALSFDIHGALAFDFDFDGFFPRHIMPGFIVSNHREIHANLVWQNGVQLRSRDLDAEALVRAEYHERRLSLWVRGSQAGRYFAALHRDLLRLITGEDEERPHLRVKYTEWVHLPDNARVGGAPARGFDERPKKIRERFRLLLEYEKDGEQAFRHESGKYRLAAVLQNMPREPKPARGAVNIHVGGDVGNFNYAGGNQHDVQVGHLSELNDKLNTWYEHIAEAVDDSALRKGALAEIKALRAAVAALQADGTDARAAAVLRRLGEEPGKLVAALQSLEAGGDAVEWLLETVQTADKRG